MDGPNQSRDESNQAALARFNGENEKKFFGEKKQRDRGRRVQKNICGVIGRRSKSEGGVFGRVGEPLQRPIEIGSGSVDEKEMIKTFGNQSPAADEWVTQDERGVVPNKSIARRRGVARGRGRDHDEKGDTFLHEEKRMDRFNGMRLVWQFYVDL